jgi:integrase
MKQLDLFDLPTASQTNQSADQSAVLGWEPLGYRRLRGRPSTTFPVGRQCIPIQAWPAPDREAFERARAQSTDPFDIPGPATQLRETTCKNYARAYGRYLCWLDNQGLLLEELPAQRLTPSRFYSYVSYIRNLMGKSSLNRTLCDFRQSMKLLAPAHDWSWITQNAAYTKLAALRADRIPREFFDPVDFFAKCSDFMDCLDGQGNSGPIAILFRDTLMAAFQCVFGWRRRNLAEMHLGKNVLISGEAVRVCLTTDETKTGAVVDNLVPPTLRRHLLRYLQWHRPHLSAARRSDALWINIRGGALGYGAINNCLNRVGLRLLGIPIHCHQFRHAIVTARIRRDAFSIGSASAQLTHRSTRTTSRFYDHSGRGAACTMWNQLRKDPRFSST